MGSTSFRFLDLPAELRLDVYDHLITRTHHRLTLPLLGQSASVTYITPDPIPPIHLICKQVHAEVAPFLRARLERMSAARETPRLIIHAGAMGPICDRKGLLDSVLGIIEESQYMDIAGDEHMKKRIRNRADFSDLQVSEDIVNTLVSYLSKTGKYVKRFNPSVNCWLDDAIELLEDPNSFHELPPDEQMIKARTLADERMAAPEARSQTQNMLILGDQHSCEKFNVQKLLQYLADNCGYWGIKVVVYTSGLGKERIDFTDPGFWLCYGGALDENTWKEEWA
jgi:hypothetical protein